MIPDDDPRHGQNAGYIASCRQDCCKAAHAKYKRDRRARIYLAKSTLSIDPAGTRRRVEGLMWLGWTMEEVSIALGHHKSWCHQMLRKQRVHLSTRDAVADLYDHWCMTLPPEKPIRSRVRNLARKRGYAPPLAWDDIDDINEKPKMGRIGRGRYEVDEAVVTRVLAGEKLPTTPAEKAEILRRWAASGRSATTFAERQGWKPDRYWREAS